jgi:Amino acid synthesis
VSQVPDVDGLEIRKVVTVIDDTFSDGAPADGAPLRKVAVAVVIKNPYAGQPYSEDLSKLVDPSDRLGALIGERCAAAAGGPVESHGKAVVVGTAGEGEHGNATKTSRFGDPFREAFGGGKAWLPSTTKRAAPGCTIDVPLCFKDEIWVRSHYDTITIQVPDAPAPDEIVLVGAVATRARLNARLGGVTKAEAQARLAREEAGA